MKPADYREKALLYRLDAGTEKGDGVRRILRSMNVALTDLTPELLGQTVGACAGISGFHKTAEWYSGPAPAEDVLIMVGFSDSRINQLLSQIRASRLPRIGLMATLTEHNRGWTLLELIGELVQERRLMGAWMSLQQAVKAAEAAETAAAAAPPDAVADGGFAEALAAARVILAGEEPPAFEAIRQADAALRAFLTGPAGKPD